MCSALKFPRSTYYAAINHVPSRREQEYNRFSEEVLSVYNEYKKRYGAIKIQRELNDKNIPCPSLYKYRKGIKLNVIRPAQIPFQIMGLSKFATFDCLTGKL